MKVGIAKAFVLTLVIGLVTIAATNSSYGQARPSSKTQVISADPLGLAYQFPLTFQYEYKAGPINSWALRAHWWPSRVSGGIGEWSGFGMGGAYRVFVADSRALTGLSVAPAVDLFFFTQTLNGTKQRSAIDGWIGGDLAYKWIFDQFSVEPLLGLRIGFGANDGPAYATGMEAIISFSGGYAW
jgi:hypothetical protein